MIKSDLLLAKAG